MAFRQMSVKCLVYNKDLFDLVAIPNPLLNLSKEVFIRPDGNSS